MTKNRLHKTLRVIVATAVGLVSLGIGSSALAADGPATTVNSPDAQPTTVQAVAAEDDVDGRHHPVRELHRRGRVDDPHRSPSTTPPRHLWRPERSSSNPERSRSNPAQPSPSGSTAPATSRATARSRPFPSRHSTPGGRHTALPITISAELLGLPAEAGAYPLEATYSSGDTDVHARETIVFTPDITARSLGVAVAAPITAQSTTTGLLSADALSATPDRPASSPASSTASSTGRSRSASTR